MPARPKRSIRQVDLGAANTEHQHTESDITDLDHYTDTDANAAIDARVNKAFVDALNVDADTLDGEHASAFADAVHTHAESDITDLDHYDSTDFDTDFATKDTDDLAEGATNLYLTDERVQDIIGAMLSGNTETRITVTYQDGDGTIDFVVDADLSNYTNTPGWIADITGENLEDLADVTITSIASGEVLVWDGTGWVNQTLAEAGISAVGHTHTESDISDLDHWDQADTEGVIDARVNKAFVDALNVDADTLDGEHASAFADAVHSHELDELDATAATDGHVLTAQGDGTAAWEAPVTGVTDHGALTGLLDDDHTQYLNGARHSSGHGAVRYGLTAPQTFATSGVNATVIWNDVIFDNDPNNFISLNTSTGVVTFNEAGLYLAMCLLLWENDGSNTTQRSHFLRYLAAPFSFGEGTIAAGRTTQAVAAWYFQQGETMDVAAGHQSGGSLDLLVNPRTSLTIVRISD